MTQAVSSISDLPNVPAVYAMYGRQRPRLYVAYVGVADKLKNRILQHPVRRDSSVATGTSAVVLNPDYVTEVWWWEHPEFAERYVLEAAEMAAFEELDPALRSRGATQARAKELYADEGFRAMMRTMFGNEPSGCLVIPTLQRALERIEELERRLGALEERLGDHE
jgi:hypothetical protein